MIKTLKYHVRGMLSAFLLTIVALSSQAQFNLRNPVLPGFYPDPSICKVGTDYFLVNSTFSYFPGIPVMHSKDLKNWKQIGNVIERPSQMDFLGEQVSRGLFAPAINYHNATFYVTCTDIDNGGNFVVTADNPAGPWSDPVFLPQARGIDPSLFFEGDKAYLIYNSDAPGNKPLYEGHRTIRMFEFDVKTLKVIGEEIQLVNGGVDISKKPVWIEGPHIYKRDGYYYLLAAEGGTSINHTQVAFRSRNVKGPYIPYEKNPILTQRHLDSNRKNPITSTGHADLVEGPDGKTYAVFLAVRPYEGDFYNTGRETFIAPVAWIDGWPVINPDNEEVQYNYSVGFNEEKHRKALPLSGNFNHKFPFKNLFNSHFLFLRTHNPSWYKLNAGKLTMELLPETCMGNGHPAFIARRQQHLVSSATTEMSFVANKENEKAGLMIFQNEFHFYYICRSISKGKSVIQLFQGNPETKKMDLVEEQVLTGSRNKIFLKIDARGDQYDFSYANEANKWKMLKANMNGRFLSTRISGGFVGSLFAIYATSSGESSTNRASYKWFGYSGNDPTFEINR